MEARVPSNLIVTVRETAGIDRVAEVVRSGVPIPRSLNWRNARALTLVDADGVPVPAEFEALARWDTGRNADAPIQWLLVTFPAGVTASMGATYRVVSDGSAGPNPMPSVRVTTARSGNHVTVDTGAATFRLGSDPGALFDEIRLPNGTRLVSGSGLSARVNGADIGHSTTRRVTIEHAGPLVAIVVVEGAYDLAPIGRGGLGSRRRYVFTAGSPTVQIRQAVSWEGDRCGLDRAACEGAPNAVRVQKIRDALTLDLPSTRSVLAFGSVSGPTVQGKVAGGQSAWVRQRLRARRTDPLAFDVRVGDATSAGTKADAGVLAVGGGSGAVAVALDHMHRYEPQALRLLPDGRVAIDLADEQAWLGPRQGLFTTFAVSVFSTSPLRPDLERVVWAPLNHPLRAWPEPAWFAASDAVDDVAVGPLAADLAGYDTLVESVLGRTLEKVDELGLPGLITFGLYPRYWGGRFGNELDCNDDPTDPRESWDNLYWCATWTDYHNTAATSPIWAMRSGQVEWLDEIGVPGALRMLHTQIIQCAPADTFNRCGQAPTGYGAYRGNFNSSHQYWDNLFLYYWLTGDYSVVETVKRGAQITRTWYCTRRPVESCSPDDPPLDWAEPSGRVASQWFAAFRFAGLASDDASFLEDYKSGLARAVTQYYVESERDRTRYGFWLGDRVAGPGTYTTDQLWMASLYDMAMLHRLQRDTNDAPIGNPPLAPSRVLAAWARSLARFGATVAPGGNGTASGTWSNQMTFTWSGPRIGGTLGNVSHLMSCCDQFLYDTSKATLTAVLVRAGRQTGDAALMQMGRDLTRLAIAASLADGSPLGKLQGEYLSRLHAAVALQTSSGAPAFRLALSVAGSGTVTSAPSGIACGSACSASYTTGTGVTLTATPTPDSTFAGWSGDEDCRDGLVTMNVARSCNANFVTTRGAVATRGATDLNGDGGGDAFRYHPLSGAWAMEFGNREGRFVGSIAGTWDAGWTIHPADFNGDGLTDLFLYNPTTGVWVKAGNLAGGRFAYFASRWDPAWRIHVLDFDGDRRSDVFLYNDTTGFWFKCYTVGAGDFRYIGGVWSPEWQTYPADQNGDGRADLFLYNRTNGRWFWAINDRDADFMYHTERWDPGWTIHAGDFNGDGRSDLFLYNTSSGRWFVATNTGPTFTYAGGLWSPGWTVHVGDFDDTGLADLFLYNPASGRGYQVITLGPATFAYFVDQWDPGWRVLLTDFNADRRSDLLLYSPVTGAWLQCLTFTPGTFVYERGFWEPGWDVAATTTKLP